MKNCTDLTVCFKTKKKLRRWRKAAQGTQTSSESKHVPDGQPRWSATETGQQTQWGWECPAAPGERLPCSVYPGTTRERHVSNREPGGGLQAEAAQEYHFPVTPWYFPLSTHPRNNGAETHLPLLWPRASSSPEAGGNIL